jgi:hypothetical protein
MDLTKEYFDQQLKTLATKDDLKPLATKDDVRREVREAVEDLARIIAETVVGAMERRFAEVKDELAMRERAQALEAEYDLRSGPSC